MNIKDVLLPILLKIKQKPTNIDEEITYDSY